MDDAEEPRGSTRAGEAMTLETLVTEAERLLTAITPAPWAGEWIAEKSNEWAVGQAFDAKGEPVEGQIVDDPDALTDAVIERRMVGMNESGHACAADAEFIAASPRLVRDLLAALRLRAQRLDELEAEVTDLQEAKRKHEKAANEALEAAEAQLQAHAQRVQAVTMEMRERVAEHRTPLATVAGCQCNPSWHADELEEWADRLTGADAGDTK